MTWGLRRTPPPNRRAATAADANWVDVGALGDLRDNRLVVQVNEASVVVVRAGGSIIAVENECPHLGTRLSDGQVSGRTIRCAAHGYRWDLATGRSLQGPRGPRRRPLREVPVRLAGDRIMLAWPVPRPGVHRSGSERDRVTATMTDPSIPASHRDLLSSTEPVTLATVGPTGYPQVSAIWAILDGDLIVTSLAGVRQKLKNLTAHPQATVFAIDPANPYRTLEVRGDVTIEPDPEFETLKKVLGAYGTDLASFGGPLEGRVTITLRPTRVVALG